MSKYNHSGGTMITAHDDCFLFIGKGKSIKIPFAEILYIEQVQGQLMIKKSGISQSIMTLPGRIRDIPCTKDERFYHCHSYLIINIARVISMSSGVITFDNSDGKHISRDCFAKTRKEFNNRLMGIR
jgi:DNA-binding LytR/AlgR family response regulator